MATGRVICLHTIRARRDTQRERERDMLKIDHHPLRSALFACLVQRTTSPALLTPLLAHAHNAHAIPYQARRGYSSVVHKIRDMVCYYGIQTECCDYVTMLLAPLLACGAGWKMNEEQPVSGCHSIALDSLSTFGNCARRSCDGKQSFSALCELSTYNTNSHSSNLCG